MAITRTPMTKGIAIDLPNSFFLITLKLGSVIGSVREVDSLISYLRAAKGVEVERYLLKFVVAEIALEGLAKTRQAIRDKEIQIIWRFLLITAI